jgi:hypothetical protein
MSTGKNTLLPSGASVKAVGGLIAVVLAILAITGIAVVTELLIKASGGTGGFAAVAASAFGVIATVAGAYFGVKVGSDQAKASAQEASRAHARAAALQSFVPAERQDDARDAVERAVRGVSS